MGAAMSDRYTATVLLEKRWEFDPAELAEVLAERFPDLGTLEGRADPDAPRATVLSVDGAEVRILLRDGPAPDAPDPDGRDRDGFSPQRLRPPGALLENHIARLELSCGGYGGGLAWAKAYASVVTLVAGALARLGPATGVLLPSPGTVLSPDEAYRAGRTALSGVSPIEAWVALYPYTPENRTKEILSGGFTRGLAAFIGREIELAPAPIDPRTALSRLHGAVWQALDGEAAEERFQDGGWFGEALSPARAQVRCVSSWLRPGVPAIVLIGSGSLVEPDTLSLRPPAHGKARSERRQREIPSIEEIFDRIELGRIFRLPSLGSLAALGGAVWRLFRGALTAGLAALRRMAQERGRGLRRKRGQTSAGE